MLNNQLLVALLFAFNYTFDDFSSSFQLMNSNFAYIVSKLMLEDYKNKYDFVQVTDQFFSYGTGKAVAKDSPLKDVFNTAWVGNTAINFEKYSGLAFL